VTGSLAKVEGTDEMEDEARLKDALDKNLNCSISRHFRSYFAFSNLS
jgi:hypothetical protein